MAKEKPCLPFFFQFYTHTHIFTLKNIYEFFEYFWSEWNPYTIETFTYESSGNGQENPEEILSVNISKHLK